jgi:hypothetical protein
VSELLTIPFKPESGKLPTAVLHRLLDAISRAGDKPLVLTLKAQKKRRSLNQNAYLWAVVYPAIVEVFREHGNNVDCDDVHSYCKDNVGKLKQVFVTPHGEVLTGPGSTAKLGTLEFEVYAEKVRAWAAETLGVAIPLPNEEVSQITNERITQ